ncbi:PDZ domain-containing protein [candidate division KSB1 bacterium]|nr:PDZ domain-containing protein [candidate division KSB1 bacterium]
MNKVKRYYAIAILGIVISIVAGFFSQLQGDSAKDRYFEVSQNIKLFGRIYKAVTDRYIEEIDAEKFIRAGIDGMLDELDPYSVYLEKEGSDEIRLMTRGKYYGVGMRIVMRNGWATVAEQPFPNSPAARAGIREGDQIIKVDGESTKNLSLSETASRLRGTEKGSEVQVKIRRVGEEEPLLFTLIRDEIVITEIEYSGFVEPGIGLIKLSRFNRGAGDQLGEAITSLKERGMEALILDLRGNPGGLLDIAVEVADHFVGKGELIVYKQGRFENSKQEYYSRHESTWGERPLVILVNELSASASEIVAGAMQDLDRAIIIGSKSYGKGLVQTVVPLDRRGEKQLKITTDAYFIPSGRLIQRDDVFESGPRSVFLGKQEENQNKSDTLVQGDDKLFYTENGRVVYGHGGITPDIEQKNFKLNRYEIELIRKSMFFNFSLKYSAEHPDLSRDFAVNDQVLHRFQIFINNKGFDYKPDGYDAVEELKRVSREDGYYDIIADQVEALDKQFDDVKEKQKQKSQEHLKLFLEREILGKAFGKDAYYSATFKADSTLITAVNVLKDPHRYDEILHNGGKKQ